MYEWHLLETDKIWDTSQEALEALLVMNMNLHGNRKRTSDEIKAY
jgi:hypothetical protein